MLVRRGHGSSHANAPAGTLQRTPETPRASVVNDICFSRPQTLPRCEYLQRRPARHLLRTECSIRAPLSEVFAFFSEAKNLEQLTPRKLSFRILTPQPIVMRAGTVIDYRIRLGPFPLRWRTVIERFEPGSAFVDSQHRGPYASWWHEHHFRAEGDSTLMEDRVYYSVPFGPLGRLVNAVLVESQLRHIFEYRARAIREIFPARAVRPPSAKSRAARRGVSAPNQQK